MPPPPLRRASDKRVVLKGLPPRRLEQALRQMGIEHPRRRSEQLFRAMYDARLYRQRGAGHGLVARWSDLEGAVSARVLERLEQKATLDGLVTLDDVVTSADGTTKLVFALDAPADDGGATREMLAAAGTSVETVVIPDGAKRNTLCVSSQSGCGLNCQFCATGRLGLRGNLAASQIVEQVVAAARHVADHRADGQADTINNVVYMGMGEPLANVAEVKQSLDVLLTERLGIQLSPNKVTVSTSGLVPEMHELMAETKAQLAVSLHATEDDTRDWLVPVNRKHNLEALIDVLERYFPKNDRTAHGATARWRNSVMIEYVLLHGCNDTDDDARRLARLLRNVRAKVNLLSFNPHAGTPFTATDGDGAARFRDVLMRAGQHEVSVRVSRGDDDMAACGQLAGGGITRDAAPEWAVPLSDVPSRFRDAVVM